MLFWRKLGVVLAAALLPVMLFAWGLTFTTYQMFATPDRLKQALDTSGIYDTFVNDLLAQTENREGQQEGEYAIPTSNPEVQAAVKNAASPTFLQSQVEGFLDNIYTWIQGESEQLAFQIDLTEVKTKLADGLVSAARTRLATLPACNGPVDPAAFDPFTAECVPRGLDANLAAEQVRSEVDKLIKNPVITQNDIKNDQSQTLEQQLQAIPTAYSRLVLGLWLGVGLILLLAAALVLLSLTRRAGLKRAGIIFTSVGVATIVLAVVGAFVIKRLTETLSGEGAVQAGGLNIISQLADGFRGWWLVFGFAVLVLGVAALISLFFIKSKPGKPVQTEPQPEAQEKPDEMPPAAAQTNKKDSTK